MGKKREVPSNAAPEDEIDVEDSSSGDTDEEITFDPVTKEERKKRADLMREMNEEGEREDEEDDEEEDDVVNVDFEFSDPKEEYFMGIRSLLRFLLLGTAKDVDFSPLADAVVKQVEAGSIVHVSEDDDVYAFLTALNLKFHKGNTTLKEILSIVLKHCPKEMQSKYQAYLSKNIGLLLNERMRNFPPEVIPHLYSSLGEDIKWALHNSDTKEAFRFEYLMIIAPCYYEKKSKFSKEKRMKLDPEHSNSQFYHFEDDVMKKYAELTFRFDVAQLGDDTLSEAAPQSRMIMIIPFDKYEDIVEDIEGLM